MSQQEDELAVAQWLEAEQALITQVCDAIAEECERRELTLAQDIRTQPLCNTHVKKDPFDGSLSFHAEWHNASGSKCGALQIRDGGQVFAEYDVIQPHPTDKRWFVEGVTLWGNHGGLKTELSLLPAVG